MRTRSQDFPMHKRRPIGAKKSRVWELLLLLIFSLAYGKFWADAIRWSSP